MKIVIIGSGYVGLVSGTCFAEFGAEVTCVDKDKSKINKLNKGEIPIYEPGLDDLVKKNTDAGRLKFTDQIESVASDTDLIFIAVGTPSRRGGGDADLSYVYSAAEEIADLLQGFTVIVNKSTVPLGTAREVKKIISEANPGADFEVASNPEFLREGSAIEDFMRPDRVVIGVETERAETLLKELYRPLNLIEAPILFTDLESAELIKYASNAFLATKISFINEISLLCEKSGADVHSVAKGMGLDNRIGKKFLHAGPGYGGSCFPKDTLALIQIAKRFGVTSKIVESTVEVNDNQKINMISKIRAALGGSEEGKVIAVLGLTFKPETDDMRDAPSLTILPSLIQSGARIVAHDPEGVQEAKNLLPEEMIYVETIDDALSNADAVVLMTEWNQYRGLGLERVKNIMRGNIFIDLRNVYEPDVMLEYGFDYHCVGR
tara:strand:- start:3618 stop:4922 length:1305 start_codon:yes stop_codon:yes gene_type:complete